MKSVSLSSIRTCSEDTTLSSLLKDNKWLLIIKYFIKLTCILTGLLGIQILQGHSLNNGREECI